MKAVIMAGGESTRLRPLTCNQPKPMVPVLDRPVMEYIVELLKRYGIEEILVTLFYLPEAIRNHFGDGSDFGVQIRYFVEEFPLGTAGSVRNARRHLDETFLVISGDTLTDINLDRLVAFHRQKNAMGTLALTKVDNPTEYGIVMTNNEGKVIKFLEKPGWSEAFSDLANTGIYVLEPEIFDYFEDQQVFDFSRDLFPILLPKDRSLYALECPEYWCDIGNIQQYRQANLDMLNGIPDLAINGKYASPGIFLGHDAIISSSASLESPCYIGSRVHIKNGVKIGGGTVVGTGSIINEGASIKRSVLWEKVFVGKKTELRGAIVGANGILRGENTVLEGAVIGCESTLGNGSQVRSGVRIWPEKNIEAGSIVSSNLVWGTRLKKFLFGVRGITGLVNIDITPEFLAKLGAAYGTVIGRGKKIAVGSDTSNASKMLKRSFISGVLSTGVDVFDLGNATSGITRYSTRLLQVDGGVQIRQSYEDETALLVEFFDKRGLNLHFNTRQKIENVFFREAFARADVEGVGDTIFLANIVAQYLEGIIRNTDFEVIQKAKYKVAFYFDESNFTSFLPVLLEGMGCTIILPTGMEHGCRVRTLDDIVTGIELLKTTVVDQGLDLGVLIDQNADRLILIDEQGNVITDEQMLTLVSFLLLKFSHGQAISISVAAPRVIQELAHEYQGMVIRTQPLNSGIIVTGIKESKVYFEQDEVPEFQIMCDAITSLAKILELMARDRVSLSTLAATVPSFYIDRQEVHCPTEDKGRVMRRLVEQLREDRLELAQGIRVFHEEGWSLVLPDDEEPIFTIFTEASSLEKAIQITRRYVAMINHSRLLEGKLQLGEMTGD